MLWAPAVIRRDSVLSVKKANNSVKKANNKDHDGTAGAKQRLHSFFVTKRKHSEVTVYYDGAELSLRFAARTAVPE